MKTLKTKITLTPVYESNYASLKATYIELDIELENGAHTVKTDMTEVGFIKGSGSVLLAGLTFWYRYDEAMEVLTLCGSKLVSEDSAFITTVPEGSTEACRQHTYSNDGNACGNNNTWNYCKHDPALQQALQDTVITANNLIIEEAKKDFTVVELLPIPNLPDELLESLNAVYRNGKFLELFDEEKAYKANDRIFNVKSIYNGEITLKSTDNFANVIGSAKDPKVDDDPWIQLWNHHCSARFGKADRCSSLDYNGFECYGRIVGGHVILGKTAEYVYKGANYVFIMPICQRHNKKDPDYMAPLQYNVGIKLANYMGS